MTAATGTISLATNWEDVTCTGVVHIPDLHGTLKRGIWRRMRRKKSREAMEEILVLVQPLDEFAIVFLHLAITGRVRRRRRREKVEFSSAPIQIELTSQIGRAHV